MNRLSVALGLVFGGISLLLPAEAVEFLALAPETLYSGQSASMSVTAFNSDDLSPVDAAFDLNLRGSDGQSYTLFSGSTGASGHVTFSFDVPVLPKGVGQLRLGPGLTSPVVMRASEILATEM